ncbi:hypothetical protein K488DRAFT_74430, partial [Vararia minispora EC-137]
MTSPTSIRRGGPWSLLTSIACSLAQRGTSTLLTMPSPDTEPQTNGFESKNRRRGRPASAERRTWYSAPVSKRQMKPKSGMEQNRTHAVTVLARGTPRALDRSTNRPLE